MKNNRSFSWYIGTAVSWMFVMAIATCISAIIIKALLMFLTWLF